MLFYHSAKYTLVAVVILYNQIFSNFTIYDVEKAAPEVYQYINKNAERYHQKENKHFYYNQPKALLLWIYFIVYYFLKSTQQMLVA